MTPSENNKRIAKNTLMLYFRMLLIMGVSLFTVRVVLDTLGTIDYGIYNVVGGIVLMFSFLSGTMAAASQRFFAFELGRDNMEQLKKIFAITMTIYAIIAIIIFALAETLGLWFLKHKMSIPPERMEATLWVYQFSILSFMMTLFTIPYNAAIIAHENMKIYAWVSIAEALLKLIVIYLLVVFSVDKLKLYAVLMFGVTVFITFIYRYYCSKKFEECRFSFYWEGSLFNEIIGFSGWNLFGSMAAVFKNQGINILLNIFFDPAINAARAIAYQVNSAIYQFVTNFSTAVNPQITKYYAGRQKNQMVRLVFQSSKFSYFLLFIFSIPILLETQFVLGLWLKELPEYVVLFTRLVIINALVDSLVGPLVTSALATGRIKKYQIIVGGTMLLNLPISYFFLKLNFPPQTTMYIAIIIAIVNLGLRLILLKKMIQFPTRSYIFDVIFKIIISSILAYIIPLILMYKMEGGLVRFIFVTIISIISTVVVIYCVGLSGGERKIVLDFAKNKVNKGSSL
ncbi:lipopolysaccharide biosynthesis protein [Mariniphaga sediminis]|uniref:lipopolysaccharide biosynthesis protein n=1 Tax=Mariniphaga sediminis TaxID=1628158 RepID=UPI00356A62D1